MRIGRNEITEELTEHIRQSGGEPGEWRWADSRFKIQDSRENPARGDGQIQDTKFKRKPGWGRWRDSRFKIQEKPRLGVMDRFKIQDSTENPAVRAGLDYREAHTTYAADDAVDYLVSAFALQLAPEAERGSALQGGRRMAAPAMTGHGRDPDSSGQDGRATPHTGFSNPQND